MQEGEDMVVRMKGEESTEQIRVAGPGGYMEIGGMEVRGHEW